MVATKVKTGMTQYMKNKPTNWVIKLFILAESSSGYTDSKNTLARLILQENMHLIQPSCLGT